MSHHNPKTDAIRLLRELTEEETSAGFRGFLSLDSIPHCRNQGP